MRPAANTRGGAKVHAAAREAPVGPMRLSDDSLAYAPSNSPRTTDSSSSRASLFREP